MSKFFDAWWFLSEHPMFNHPDDVRALKGETFEGKPIPVDPRFLSNLDIAVVKVNPKTNKISDHKKKNTSVRVWLEAGGWDEDEHFGVMQTMGCHDWRLDCGGKTFEKAIIKLAKNVRKYYNDDGTGKETASETLEKWHAKQVKKGRKVDPLQS